MITFYKSDDYIKWFNEQTLKVQVQIDSRLDKIKEFNHYGHNRKLSNLLSELKFNNGNRIYYTEIIIDNKSMILILGGNKNGQDKDIKKAQKIAEKIHQR